MKVIVGLGNPGNKYLNTRHNIGFMAVDFFHKSHNFYPFKNKFNGLFSEGKIADRKVFLFKPITYMNNSGVAVRSLASFYGIDLEDIIVFHDDLDLPFLKIKIKKGGGSGGHNGLKSIDLHLGRDYYRLRLGINHPGDKDKVADYVLSDFCIKERKLLSDLFTLIDSNISSIIEKNIDLFMNNLVINQLKEEKNGI